MNELKISPERPDKNLTVLKLSGEFEGLAILDSQERLFGYVKEEVGTDLMMDFAEIDYIDSAGIGVLLQMAKMASQKNLKFGLLNVNDQVKKVLAVTKVDKILKVY